MKVAEAEEKEEDADDVARLQEENRKLNKELQKKEQEQKVTFLFSFL